MPQMRLEKEKELKRCYIFTLIEMEAEKQPELIKQQLQPQQSADVQQAPQSTSAVIYYLLIAIVGILIIALVVVFIYRHANGKTEEIGAELEEARKENALLKTQIEQHEAARTNYIRHIDRLTNEIDELTTAKNQPFNPSLPMTENSYEAPSPDQRPTKPTIVQNKEAIKAMVNSPRRTVQDEINDAEASKLEQTENDTNQIKSELLQVTNTPQHDDENDVQNIMNIIQAQE